MAAVYSPSLQGCMAAATLVDGADCCFPRHHSGQKHDWFVDARAGRIPGNDDVRRSTSGSSARVTKIRHFLYPLERGGTLGSIWDRAGLLGRPTHTRFELPEECPADSGWKLWFVGSYRIGHL